MYNPQCFQGALILDACSTASLKSSTVSYCVTCIRCLYLFHLFHTAEDKNWTVILVLTMPHWFVAEMKSNFENSQCCDLGNALRFF